MLADSFHVRFKIAMYFSFMIPVPAERSRINAQLAACWLLLGYAASLLLRDARPLSWLLTGCGQTHMALHVDVHCCKRVKRLSKGS